MGFGKSRLGELWCVEAGTARFVMDRHVRVRFGWHGLDRHDVAS